MSARIEKELVRAAQCGDESAWGEIVARTHGPLARFLFARCRDEATSLDLVQETFTAALQSIGNLGPPYRVLGWLRRIAGRRLARHVESMVRRREVPLAVDPAAGAGADVACDLEELRARLAALPPHYREMLRLHYLLDEPVGEIATRLALPVGTVKRRLHVGRQMMAGKRPDAKAGRHEIRAVPEIRVEPRPGEELSVKVEGPLVPYGSNLEPGDAEVFDWFHYPGGLWRERTATEIRRPIEIAGRPCVEIHVDFLSTEEGRYAFRDGAEEFLYVSTVVGSTQPAAPCSHARTGHVEHGQVESSAAPAGHGLQQATTPTPVTEGLAAVLRVSRDSPEAAIEVDGKPFIDDPFPLPRMTAGTEDGDGRYDAVDLRIGGVEYGVCLRRTWATLENRGSAAEWYFTPDGRCVLMRRYNGPEWDNYESLSRARGLVIEDVEYRLWHDCVLWAGEAE